MGLFSIFSCTKQPPIPSNLSTGKYDFRLGNIGDTKDIIMHRERLNGKLPSFIGSLSYYNFSPTIGFLNSDSSRDYYFLDSTNHLLRGESFYPPFKMSDLYLRIKAMVRHCDIFYGHEYTYKIISQIPAINAAWRHKQIKIQIEELHVGVYELIYRFDVQGLQLKIMYGVNSD